MGFRNMLLGYRDADRGHILENIVFLELIRRDYRVYIGKVAETEIDFVAEKANDKLYIQVTESMQSPETRERENFDRCARFMTTTKKSYCRWTETISIPTMASNPCT